MFQVMLGRDQLERVESAGALGPFWPGVLPKLGDGREKLALLGCDAEGVPKNVDRDILQEIAVQRVLSLGFRRGDLACGV